MDSADIDDWTECYFFQATMQREAIKAMLARGKPDIPTTGELHMSDRVESDITMQCL